MRRRKGLGQLGAVMIKSGQWYDFEDYNGYGCCETDHELHFDEFIILLEAKLTQSDAAVGQMCKLYLPVMKLVWQKPVIPVQVCKNLRYHPEALLGDIETLITKPEMKVWTWHYLGDY